MAEAKSSQASQAVQTILVVLISILLTTLLVLLWSDNKGESSNFDSEEDTNQMIAERLVADSALLAVRLGDNEDSLDQALERAKAAEITRDSYSGKIVELNEKLAKAKNTLLNREQNVAKTKQALEENLDLNKEINNLNSRIIDLLGYKDENAKLQDEIANLQALNTSDRKKIESSLEIAAASSRLQRELEIYKIENGVQKEKITELEVLLNKKALFVKNHDDLSPEAVQLFRRLKQLNATEQEGLLATYASINTELKARCIRKVSFQEGAASIKEVEKINIRNQIDGIDEGSFFLVVGYASLKGGNEVNKKLSSSRATATAIELEKVKKSGQAVQAVYLGQTDRFSREDQSMNQVCEIWKIDK